MKQLPGGEYTRNDMKRFCMIGKMCCGSVLDIGAGDGSMVKFLHESCLTYKAIDPEPTKNSVRGDIYTMDTSKKYDTVLLLEVLEHLENPLKALEIIRTIINPTGKLILSVPNPYNTDQIASVLHNDINIENQNHIAMFGDNEIKSLCYHAGYSKVNPIRFYTKVPGLNWLSPIRSRFGEWSIYEVLP
jgi:2-polyprenyl-3-methyl-5-hydroxy-6-metoxy-1,4-benzoquinol methylase